MATFTGTANIFTKAKQKILAGSIDFSADTFKVLLTTSGYTPGIDSNEFVSDVTNEVSGNGYARQAVTPSIATFGSTVSAKFTDPAVTASGGSITARYWVLFKDTGGADTANPVIAYGLLDNTPADVVITDGNSGTVDFSDANGLISW